MTYKVNLTYYKASGKFYSEGSYLSEQDTLLDIWDEVEQMRVAKELPEVGGDYWIIQVDAPDCPGNHPHLINTFKSVDWHRTEEIKLNRAKDRYGA